MYLSCELAFSKEKKIRNGSIGMPPFFHLCHKIRNFWTDGQGQISQSGGIKTKLFVTHFTNSINPLLVT